MSPSPHDPDDNGEFKRHAAEALKRKLPKPESDEDAAVRELRATVAERLVLGAPMVDPPVEGYVTLDLDKLPPRLPGDEDEFDRLFVALRAHVRVEARRLHGEIERLKEQNAEGRAVLSANRDRIEGLTQSLAESNSEVERQSAKIEALLEENRTLRLTVNRQASQLAAFEGIEPRAHLGYATTRQLLNEITARIDVDSANGGGGLDYTTVGGKPGTVAAVQDYIAADETPPEIGEWVEAHYPEPLGDVTGQVVAVNTYVSGEESTPTFDIRDPRIGNRYRVTPGTRWNRTESPF